MTSPSFEAPTLEALAALLPAYDFESFIAQGGMGAVYKALQRSLDRDVAIKVLPRELGADPDFRRSFATEARAMARLNHPNLISVYDSGDVDGMPYIVMEFVNGKSLYHSAYNLSVEPVQAASIVKGICDGLAHAHENGVIHRDIKPANILLTPKTEPKIGDFGLAHAGDGPGLVMGTPGYTAPEVMANPEVADRRSDIFSVGVILYELLTGRQPPTEGGIPAPSSLCGCDTVLDQICFKAMNPSAAARYQDAHDMSVALDNWIRKANAPSPFPGHEAPARVSAVPRPAQHVVVTTKGGGGGGAVVKTLITAAVLVGIGAAAWQYKKGEDEKMAAETARVKKIEEDRKAAAEKAEKERLEKERAVKNFDPFADESTWDSLQRLKALLVAGKRDQMPKGTFLQHGAHSLAISTPMSWHQAQNFAEAYGGYLATTLADDDLKAFVKELKAIPGASQMWTGAGRVGRDSWSLIDGSPWTLAEPPPGIGEFVAVDDLGILHAVKEQEKLPFIIQWRYDGTNPGTVEANLKRTADTLNTAQPVFPPGTWVSGGRRALAVFRPGPEAEAWKLAKDAGGHLAVTSGKDEANWLSDQVEKLAGPAGFWIGAVRKGKAWNWMTHETWDATGWDAEYPKEDGAAVVIVPAKGWRNVDPGTRADGFIIEWSKDRDSAPKGAGDDDGPGAAGGGSSSAGPIELTGVALDLRNRAKEVIAKDEAERQAALAKNAATFRWDLDTWHRSLSKGENLKWKPDIDSLKAKVDNNRVPDSDPGVRLSDRMSEVCKRCAEKQKGIDAEFRVAAGNKRDLYVKNLEKNQANASPADAESISKAIAEAKDLDAWVTALGVTKTSTARSSGKKDAIVGNWVFNSGGKIAIAEDGTASYSGESGLWMLTSGEAKTRTYELTWNNGDWDKLTLSADGNHLEGTNNKGPSNAVREGF